MIKYIYYFILIIPSKEILQKELVMNCPYLAKDVVYFCVSEYKNAVVCGSRLKKFCRTDTHKKCPRYAASDRAG